MVALAATCLALATAAAQEANLPSPFRTLESPYTLPAIDRGLRANDPPREPRRLDRQYATDSLIVKFRPGTTVPLRAALLALVDGTEAPDLPHANFEIVSLRGGTDPETAARVLSAQPDVEYAQARYRVGPMFRPNDEHYPKQWNFPAIDMERAWDINPGAAPSIVVAVLDTGVAYQNAVFTYRAQAFSLDGIIYPSLGEIRVEFAAAPDLGPRDRFMSPRDFIWNDNDPVDLDGHGTHITGTVGQLTNNSLGVAGTAFNVRIMPVKVIAGVWDQIFGAPGDGTDDTVARGIRYAVDNGAKVLNMSIGRSGGQPAPVIQDALNYAVSRGAFVAIAAGNDFLDGNPIQRPADIAPAIEGVVAVGAVGRDLQRAFYSSTGSFVELAAPGGDQRRGGGEAGILQQTYDLDLVETYLLGPSRYRAPRFDSFAYYFFQGTSSAAPHVAGFAAMLMQQGITSPAAIEAAMKRYATDLGPAGRDNEYGHGLINPRAALRGMGLAK